MHARFQDFEDEHNPRNAQMLGDRAAVVALFDELCKRRAPFMCQFTGDNGFNLIVGIGGDYGCAQYSSNDGMPPFLMAVDIQGSPADRDMEFLVGGTPTPIDRKYRVPIEQVREAVAEFVTTGRKGAGVRWVDLDAKRHND
jgi:hypothetical protein